MLTGSAGDFGATCEGVLMESLARAQADEIDADVPFDGGSQSPDKLDNTHRRARVEPEDVVRVRQLARDDRESGCLGCGH